MFEFAGNAAGRLFSPDDLAKLTQPELGHLPPLSMLSSVLFSDLNGTLPMIQGTLSGMEGHPLVKNFEEAACSNTISRETAVCISAAVLAKPQAGSEYTTEFLVQKVIIDVLQLFDQFLPVNKSLGLSFKFNEARRGQPDDTQVCCW